MHPASPSTPNGIGLLFLPNELRNALVEYLGSTELLSLTWLSQAFNKVFSGYLLERELNKEDFCWAARCGQVALLQELLKVKASDVRFPRDNTNYPHKRGPSFHAVGNYGRSVRCVIETLIDAGFEPPVLWYTCKRQNYGAALAVLRKGDVAPSPELLVHCVSEIKAKSNGGFVPDNLVRTFAKFQRQVVEQLLSKPYCVYSKINAVDRSSQSGEEAETALIRAVREGNLWAVKLLLKSGASPHARGSFGTTPAKAAIVARNSDALQALLEADGSICQMGGDQRTLYDWFAPSDVKAIIRAGTSALSLRTDCYLTVQVPGDYPAKAKKEYTLLEHAIYEAAQGHGDALRLIKQHSKSDNDWLVKYAYDALKNLQSPSEWTLAEIHDALPFARLLG